MVEESSGVESRLSLFTAIFFPSYLLLLLCLTRFSSSSAVEGGGRKLEGGGGGREREVPVCVGESPLYLCIRLSYSVLSFLSLL